MGIIFADWLPFITVLGLAALLKMVTGQMYPFDLKKSADFSAQIVSVNAVAIGSAWLTLIALRASEVGATLSTSSRLTLSEVVEFMETILVLDVVLSILLFLGLAVFEYAKITVDQGRANQGLRFLHDYRGPFNIAYIVLGAILYFKVSWLISNIAIEVVEYRAPNFLSGIFGVSEGVTCPWSSFLGDALYKPEKLC